MLELKQMSELVAPVFLGESLIPPSLRPVLEQMSLDEFQQRYPLRHNLYLHGADILKDSIGKQVPLDVDGRDTLHMLNGVDQYILSHTSGDQNLLREHQVTVFEDFRDFLEQGNRFGYVKLPTGSGKTVLFIELARAMDVRALIATPTKLLVDQTDERFHQFAEKIDTGKIYSDRKDYDNNVTITTYDSFVQKLQEGKLRSQEYRVLMLDEAHKALSKRRSALVSSFPYVFGFTATPKYAENKQLKDLLPYEIHSMGIKEAVEQGILSPLSVFLVETSADLSKAKVTAGGDFDPKDLEKALNIATRNVAAVEVYKKMFSDKLAVAYCVTIKHAQDLAQMFEKQGVPADFVSGEMTREEQEEKLRWFKDGKIKVLCNADLLIEGFDEPKASVCLNLRPTLSPVVAEQRAGRVLRLDPDNPEKHAYIVDFLDQGNSKHIPVSFAQIIEASHVFSKVKEYQVGSGFGPVRYPGIDLDISGVRVITDAQEVIRIVHVMIGQTEEGKLTLPALSRRFRLAEISLLPVLASLKKAYPTEFGSFEDREGRFVETVSPQIVELLREIINTQAPEGWAIKEAATGIVGKSWGYIESHASSYREAHPEWFKFYHHASGIREHYSPELLNALKEGNPTLEMEKAHTTDLTLTNKDLMRIFEGSLKPLQAKAQEAVRRLSKSHPGIFVLRSNGPKVVTVCTDPERFKQLMTDLGAIPRRDLLEAQPTDFPVSTRYLTSMFQGSGTKLICIAREVAKALQAKHPDLFVTRKSGSRAVLACTNQSFFLDAMQKSGVKLKLNDLVRPKDGEIVISSNSLATIFIGSDMSLRKAAEKAIKKLSEANLGLVQRRRVGRASIANVCTNPQAFIEEMAKLGFRLRASNPEEVQPKDFLITHQNLASRFVGTSGKLYQVAQDVISELRKSEPGIFVKRRNKSKITMVCTNESLFTQAMVQKGIKIRE